MMWSKQNQSEWLFSYCFVHLSYFVCNALYFRVAPSSKMPNGMQLFSVQQPFFPLPPPIFFFFFFKQSAPCPKFITISGEANILHHLDAAQLFPLQTKIIPKSSSQNTNQPLVSLWIMYFELQMFGSTYIYINRFYPFSSKIIILKEIKKYMSFYIIITRRIFPLNYNFELRLSNLWKKRLFFKVLANHQQMCLNDYLYNAQQLRTTGISRKRSAFVELRPQKHVHL